MVWEHTSMDVDTEFPSSTKLPEREGEFLLKAMDHTHCFTCGREWTQRLAHVDTMKDRRVFGLFPEFREFLKPDVVSQATADLKLITSEVVTEMTKLIPKEWDVKREALDALVDLVVGRATFVAETITSRICRKQRCQEPFIDICG